MCTAAREGDIITTEFDTFNNPFIGDFNLLRPLAVLYVHPIAPQPGGRLLELSKGISGMHTEINYIGKRTVC